MIVIVLLSVTLIFVGALVIVRLARTRPRYTTTDEPVEVLIAQLNHTEAEMKRVGSDFQRELDLLLRLRR